MVFVEILKQFLLNQGYAKSEINISNDLSSVDRVKVVLSALKDVVMDDEHKRKVDLFERCVGDIFVNEDLLIKFVLFLKEVYECYHVITYSSLGNSECSNIHTVKNDINSDNDLLLLQDNNNNKDQEGLVDQRKNDVMYSLICSERFSISPNNKTICRNYSHSNFNFHLCPSSNNNKNDHKQSFTSNTIDSHNSTNNQTCLNINNNNNNNTTYKHNNSINYKHKTINHDINTNNIGNNTIYNYQPHYKYYTTTPKAKHLHKQIHLTAGIITSSTQSTHFNYYSFVKPTCLINSISLSSLSKHKSRFIPYKTRSSDSKPQTLSSLVVSSHLPSPPLSPEAKIKKWLLSLHLISNKDLNTPLATLSPDGTLLCNILNRNEPPYQVIKGIFVSPTTPNQIRININKACVYISTHMHYFVNHYLKENKCVYEEELMKGNNAMMFYVIESLYKYYNRLSSNSRNRFNKNNRLLAYNSVTHNEHTFKVNSVYNVNNALSKKKNKSNCSSSESLKLSQVDGCAFIKYWDVDDELQMGKGSSDNKHSKHKTIEATRTNNKNANLEQFKRKSYSCKHNNNHRRERNRYDDNDNANEYQRNNKEKGHNTVKCFLLFQKSNLDKMKKEIAIKNNIIREYNDD